MDDREGEKKTKQIENCFAFNVKLSSPCANDVVAVIKSHDMCFDQLNPATETSSQRMMTLVYSFAAF